MQAEKNQHLALKKIYPPAPKTKRGDFSFLDIANDHFLYFNGPTLIVRPFDSDKELKYFTHKSDVLAAKFSNDGKFIASIDQKGTLIIHQLGEKTLYQTKKYDAFYPNAKAIDWSADKKRICVVGAGKQTFGRVALVQTGTNAGEITGVSANLTCCSFRPQRPYHLVTGGDEFILKFYQGPPYKFSKSSDKNHSNYINSIKFSPSGSYLISVSSDKKIVLYNGQNFQFMKERINCHERSILGIDWIDDKTFITISADKKIKIWSIDLQELSTIKSCDQNFLKDSKSFDHFQVAVKFYKGQIYSLSLNGEITKHSIPNPEEKMVQFNEQKVRKFAGWVDKPLVVINYSTQEKKRRPIIVDTSGKILFGELKSSNMSLSQMNLLQQTTPTYSAFLNVIYNPFSESINILRGDGSLVDAQISNSKQIKEKLVVQNKKFRIIAQPTLNNYNLLAVSDKIFTFSHNQVKSSEEIGEDSTYMKAFEKLIFVGTIKGNLLVFDGETLVLLTKVNLSATKISHIYIENAANQGQFIVICGDALGKLSISKFCQQKKQLQDLPSTLGNHQSLITSILPYNNTNFLFTCGMDNKINLWHKIESGKYSRQQDWRNTHQLGITSAQIIGDRLFTVGGDYLIKQWEISI